MGVDAVARWLVERDVGEEDEVRLGQLGFVAQALEERRKRDGEQRVEEEHSETAGEGERERSTRGILSHLPYFVFSLSLSLSLFLGL